METPVDDAIGAAIIDANENISFLFLLLSFYLTVCRFCFFCVVGVSRFLPFSLFA